MKPDPEFTRLKVKYQLESTNNQYLNSKFLYVILLKADIDINLLNEIDWLWLKDNLLPTYKFLTKIKEEEKKRQEKKELAIKQIAKNKLGSVYTKYSSLFKSTPVELLGFQQSFNTEYATKAITGKFSSILLKLDEEGELSQEEIDYLILNKLDREKFIKLSEFVTLKRKYNALDYPGVSPSDRLNSILKKLEDEVCLTDKDNRFLNTNNLNSVLEFHSLRQQKFTEDFIRLKEKYQAELYQSISLDDPLYKILKEIDVCAVLSTEQINWLRRNNLIHTASVAEFISLKHKYSATSNDDLSISSHLYKVLMRIDSNSPIAQSDSNFLKKRGLTETVTIAVEKYTKYLIGEVINENLLSDLQKKWLEENEIEVRNYTQRLIDAVIQENSRSNISKEKLEGSETADRVIFLGKTYQFMSLKSKYEIADLRDNSGESPLYNILRKLDKNERLNAEDVLYLSTQMNILHPGEKLYLCYHTIEAEFYEKEYKDSNNKWFLPNISSHWRKAEQPEKALKSTNIDIEKIGNDNKLKSAILTSRGGAFRDIQDLNNAEQCARSAMKLQPSSYHPYTLMGAICYDRYDSREGDKWFEEARKIGAPLESIDAEIKQAIHRMTDKNKRDKIIQSLLNRDPLRYDWANRLLGKKLISEFKNDRLVEQGTN
jgi:hypothetical protein